MRKPTPNNQTEYHIKKQVQQILTTTGWNWWMPSADIYGRNGVSDFLAVKYPKLFMAIETKYDDMATALQFAFLKGIHEAGHYAFLVDETNVEELRDVLERQQQHTWPPGDVHRKLYGFAMLMKWQTQIPFDIRISKSPKKKVIDHVNTPTNQEHRAQTTRPVAHTDDLAWGESSD